MRSISQAIREFDGDVSTIYGLWLSTARQRPLEFQTSKAAFENKYFKNPLVERTFCLVSFYEGRAMGAIHATCVRPRRMANINIWVMPEHQGKGVGSLLLARMLDELKHEPNTLQVYPVMVPLCPNYTAFFRRRGFAPHPEYPSGYMMEMKLEKCIESLVPNGIAIRRVEDIENYDEVDQMAMLDRTDAKKAGIDFKVEAIIEEIRSSIKDAMKYCYSVASLDGRVVGYARQLLLKSFSGRLLLKNTGLIVADDHRNRGIGRALLGDGLNWGFGLNAETSYISTDSKNPARFLYEKVGYRIVDTLDILVMNFREG
jgi:GNAT superfamily N-acetyltransferase